MLLVRGVIASIEREDRPRKEKDKDGKAGDVVGVWHYLTYKIFVRMFGKADLVEISEMQSDEQGVPVTHPDLQMALDKGVEVECLVSVQPRVYNGAATLNYRILHVKLAEGAENVPPARNLSIGDKSNKPAAAVA